MLPIPKDLLSQQRQLSQGEGVVHEVSGDADLESARPSCTSPEPAAACRTLLGLTNAKLPAGGVISEAHLLSIGQTSETAQKLLLTNIDNEIELKVAGQGQTSFKLLSMPTSIDTRNTAITIKAPLKAGEKLHIMLNKKTAQGYSLSDGKRAQFPTMVDRELASITQVDDPTILGGEFDQIFPSITKH